VPGGNHFDGLYPTQPDLLRPILPCHRAAFEALERWVNVGVAPPSSRKLADTAPADPINTCTLA
jgi:hypothetical protein